MKSGKKEIRNSIEYFLSYAILKFGHEKFVKKTRTLYLNLFSVQLGNGEQGTDVRVRNNRLHCQNCYSNDEGQL